MDLRRATTDDAEAIVALWRASGATLSATDSPEHVRRAIEQPWLAVMLAVVGNHVVGSVIGTFDGWRGNIYRLVVHPQYRRKGVARSLVAATEKVFDEWGVTRVTALVEKNHADAVGFWNAAGYTLDDRIVRHVKTLKT